MNSTIFGDMPRATAAPPSEYSNIRDQPINQATLEALQKEPNIE